MATEKEYTTKLFDKLRKDIYYGQDHDVAEFLVGCHAEKFVEVDAALKIVWQKFKEMDARIGVLEPKPKEPKEPKPFDQPSLKIKIKKSDLP